MHSASKRMTCVGAAVASPKPRAMTLRWLALPLVLLALTPAERLRAIARLGGSRPLGGDRWRRWRHWWHRRQRRCRQQHRRAGNQRHPGRPSTNQIIGPSLNIPIGGGVPSVAAEHRFGHQHAQRHDQQRTVALSGPHHQRRRQHRQSGRPRRAGGGQSTAAQRRAAGRRTALRRRRGHGAAAVEPDGARDRRACPPPWPDPRRVAAHRAHRHDLPSLAHSGGRDVPDIIRAIEAETGVGAAQPNYRFTLVQQQRASCERRSKSRNTRSPSSTCRRRIASRPATAC